MHVTPFVYFKPLNGHIRNNEGWSTTKFGLLTCHDMFNESYKILCNKQEVWIN